MLYYPYSKMILYASNPMERILSISSERLRFPKIDLISNRMERFDIVFYFIQSTNIYSSREPVINSETDMTEYKEGQVFMFQLQDWK
jgi:hypothetical protein